MPAPVSAGGYPLLAAVGVLLDPLGIENGTQATRQSAKHGEMLSRIPVSVAPAPLTANEAP